MSDYICRVEETSIKLRKFTTGHTMKLLNIVEELNDKKVKALVTELVEGALLDSLISRANRDKQLEIFEEKEENIFEFGDPVPGIGWYAPEYQPDGNYYFRWMGQSSKALFSTICKKRNKVTIKVSYTNKKVDVFKGLSISINGTVCHGKQIESNKNTTIVGYDFSSDNEFHYISLCFECKIRFQSSNPADTRKLGVAVSKIEII